ncbi:hypothetical protein Hsc_2787 [Herbaspirillum seropedicae]|nr:hypothetical protein Hsc_2787 [Herbaspirillum seropedicae]
MHNDLRSKTVKAISHVGLGNAVGKLVSLSTTLVLARLLSPAEYGLMEIAMMLIAFIGFFNEIGLTTAIVQRPQLSQEQVNGCFLIAMGCSVVLFLLTLLAAGPLAGFFRQPQLQPMISTLAVGFIMGAAGSVPEAFLRKQMQFKAMAGITILGIVLQSAVSLGLALAGMGVWSLVWGSLVATATYSGGYFLLSPWRPRGRYGVREAVELVLFGLCDGASAALLHASADARVRAMVLVNPWARTEAGQAQAYLKHYYRARLTSPDLWNKILRGQFNAVAALRSLLGQWRRAASPPAATPELLPIRLQQAYERFRGPVLLILSGADLTAREFADLATPGMPTTGGRPDIGLLPGWNVLWLLSMDRRAREASLGTGDLAGSWSIHYRDRSSDRPVSLARFPALTLLGQPGDARNPRTGKSEAFPPCQGCSNPNIADSAHMPAMNYLPYLLTGDYYQLEELQFWATWAVFKSNPAYRGYAQGLVHRSQVRDQAWTLRSLGQAAYITPDDDALKKELQDIVKNNLDWYTAQYVNNSQANRLGIIVDNAIVYHGNTGIAPWMDDFFTSSIGYLNDLGYQEALPLLRYKAAFPVARMTHPSYCWIFGAAYSIPVRPDQNAPLYTDLGQAYQAMLAANYRDNAPALAQTACASDAMAQLLKLRGGEMTGYSSQPAGFPSNLQPALAYSVDSDAPGARQAWERFMWRSVKPDYGLGPQFSVMPRTAGKSN